MGKTYTRQSRKVLWAFSEFFQEIEKNGTSGHGRMFASAKESNKSKFESYSDRNSVLILSHMTFRYCGVLIFSNNCSLNSCVQTCD